MNNWWRLLVAIYRREPWGHIKDCYGLATGRLVECGKPPHVYLMHRDFVKRAGEKP